MCDRQVAACGSRNIFIGFIQTVSIVPPSCRLKSSVAYIVTDTFPALQYGLASEVAHHLRKLRLPRMDRLVSCRTHELLLTSTRNPTLLQYPFIDAEIVYAVYGEYAVAAIDVVTHAPDSPSSMLERHSTSFPPSSTSWAAGSTGVERTSGGRRGRLWSPGEEYGVSGR